MFGKKQKRTAKQRSPLDESSENEYPTSWGQYQRGEWPYEVVPKNPDEDEDAIQRMGMHEFAFEAENGELYAGCYPRAMINNAAYGEQPLMIGTDNYNQPVGVLHKERYRHIFSGGQTGTGKSTFSLTACLQDAFEGNGFCFIDPGGDDSLKLIQRLPEYRLDDLIYIDVGNEYREYSVGLNYLDTLHEPGEPGYKRECEAIAMNLLPLLEADEYARMQGVASNVLRYLIKADYEDEEYSYTLIDLYYLLGTEEARASYADQVNQDKLEFLKPYATKIAELPDNELEPLIRRLQTWVESDIVRPFIAQRDSDFSIAQAIANNREIVVRCNVDKKTRTMVAAAITTKIWSAISARPSPADRKMMELEGVDVPDIGYTSQTTREDLDYDPFFLVADEFHAIVSPEMNVGEMLAMARKKGLGLLILTQQLNQLPKKQQQQILSNCSTLVAFDPGEEPTEKQVLAGAFNDVDQQDLNLGRFSFWTTITDKDGDISPPFVTDAIPPMPPLRSVEEANAAINRSQREFGSKRLTDQEILQQVPDEFSHMISSMADASSEDASGVTEDPKIAAVYKAAYITQLKHDALGEAVPYGAVVEEWKSLVDVTLSDNKIANLFEQIPSSDIARAKRKGERVIKLTTEGIERAGLTQDTGDAENAGGFDHRLVLTKARAAYTVLGYDTWLPTQDSNEAADGMADLPIDPFDSRDPVRHDQLVDELKEKHPQIYRHSGKRHVSIEAECSTMDAPQQTLTNLRKAINSGRLCVFALKDETFNDDRNNQFDYWRERGEKIIYDTYRDGNQVKINYDQITCARSLDEDGNRTFYNHKKQRLMIEEGVYAVRPHREERSRIRWKEDGEEIVIYDLSETGEDGEPAEYARFDGPEAVANPMRADVMAYSEYDDEREVHVVRTADGGREEYATKAELKDNWKRIYLPFIPENEYDRPPREDDFRFEVYPESGNQKYDEPQLADRGEIRPLLPPDITMPEVSSIVSLEEENDVDEEAESDDSEQTSVTSEDSMGTDVSSDSGPASGYDPDEVTDSIVADTELAANDVAPAVERIEDRIDGLSREQAIEAVQLMLDVELGNHDSEDTPIEESEDTSNDVLASPTDQEPSDGGEEQSSSTDEPMYRNEKQGISKIEDQVHQDGDQAESTPDTSLPLETVSTDASPSDLADKDPIIQAGTDENTCLNTTEEILSTTSASDSPDEGRSDNEMSAPIDDHPLVEPLALIFSDQTDLNNDRVRQTTTRLLHEFDSPTYPSMVRAVANELDAEIDLEQVSSDYSENEQNGSVSSPQIEISKDDFWE